ncbi:trypsin-like serine protease [Spiractinospora alimapuensis]|nr:trypsin-like serine protease [Spiractinospora alimapuensis]
MQRDLGVDADEVARLFTDQAQARLTDQDLRDALGDAYAGSVFDPESGELTVSVTDPAATDTVEDAEANARLVTYGTNTLDGAVDALNGVDPFEAARWYTDVTQDQVVIEVPQGQTVEGELFAANAGIDTGMVDIQETSVRYETFEGAPEDGTDDTAPAESDIVGGLAYTTPSGRCSVGFAVAPRDTDDLRLDVESEPDDQGDSETEEDGGKDPVPASVSGFATAGHCGGEGVPTESPDGIVEESLFPGDGDRAWVSSTWHPTALVSQYDTGGFVRVSGSDEAPVGSTVCRSGSTTGWHCGVVEATNVSVSYPEGVVDGVTATTVCAEPGDSGGPFVSDTQAQGVTSGGSGDCGGGQSVTFFQPINELLAEYDLDLVTTDGPAGPPDS